MKNFKDFNFGETWVARNIFCKKTEKITKKDKSFLGGMITNFTIYFDLPKFKT